VYFIGDSGNQARVIVYAIAAAQATLLALALWRRAANIAANHVLSGWTALVAVDLGVKAAFLASGGGRWTVSYAVVGLFPFLHASLFYIYVRALTTGRGFGARDLVHFAGFAAAFVAASPLSAGSSGWRGPGPWIGVFLLVYAFAYVIAAMLRIARFRRQLRERRADADRQSLQWLGAMAASQALIWGFAALQESGRVPFVSYYMIYGAVALWVFVTGWFSLAQPPVPAQLPAEDTELARDPAIAMQAVAGADAARSGAEDDARFPEVEARLARLMADEHLYREPALTIGQLARRSGYPEYLVSAVINRRLGATFWDYVNHLRIDAVRELLADPGETRTILDLAYACGFTSKSTFNAAFRRETGETPSDYRRRHARNGSPASAG
jgi:AraC-like DNA-binding protein